MLWCLELPRDGTDPSLTDRKLFMSGTALIFVLDRDGLASKNWSWMRARAEHRGGSGSLIAVVVAEGEVVHSLVPAIRVADTPAEISFPEFASNAGVGVEAKLSEHLHMIAAQTQAHRLDVDATGSAALVTAAKKAAAQVSGAAMTATQVLESGITATAGTSAPGQRRGRRLRRRVIDTLLHLVWLCLLLGLFIPADTSELAAHVSWLIVVVGIPLLLGAVVLRDAEVYWFLSNLYTLLIAIPPLLGWTLSLNPQISFDFIDSNYNPLLWACDLGAHFAQFLMGLPIGVWVGVESVALVAVLITQLLVSSSLIDV